MDYWESSTSAWWILSAVFFAVAVAFAWLWLNTRRRLADLEQSASAAPAVADGVRVLEQAFDQAPLPLVLLVHDRHLERASQAFYAIAERAGGAAARSDWLALVHPDDRSLFEKSLRAGSQDTFVACRVLGDDGAYRSGWVGLKALAGARRPAPAWLVVYTWNRAEGLTVLDPTPEITEQGAEPDRQLAASVAPAPAAVEGVDAVALVRSELVRLRVDNEKRRLEVDEILPDEPLYVAADGPHLARAVRAILCEVAATVGGDGRIAVWLTATADGGSLLLKASDVRFAERGGETASSRINISEICADLEPDELAMTEHWLSRQGGELSMRGREGERGLEFFLRLPLLRRDPRERAKTNVPAGKERRATGRHVLVIEDNLDLAETMEMMLDSMHYEVRVARDGLQGVELARERAPDVVLCDIGLPRMDGYAVAKSMRVDLGLNDAFLIALTGYGREEDKRRAKEAGFDMHLTKPVDPSYLSQLLKSLEEGGPIPSEAENTLSPERWLH